MEILVLLLLPYPLFLILLIFEYSKNKDVLYKIVPSKFINYILCVFIFLMITGLSFVIGIWIFDTNKGEIIGFDDDSWFGDPNVYASSDVAFSVAILLPAFLVFICVSLFLRFSLCTKRLLIPFILVLLPSYFIYFLVLLSRE